MTEELSSIVVVVKKKNTTTTYIYIYIFAYCAIIILKELHGKHKIELHCSVGGEQISRNT